MKSLVYATGNQLKFRLASSISTEYGIELAQRPLEIDEIQSTDVLKVAEDKAQKAFDIVKQPVFITDDSWNFPGLGGFPGAYMHDIAAWLTVDDFIRLTSQLTDRRVFLTQTAVYQDRRTQKAFSVEHAGTLLDKPRGNYAAHPHFSLIAMPHDDGRSMAEAFSNQEPDTILEVWRQLFGWLSSKSGD